MEWWNDIKQLSKVYLTSSEQMDRSGPVPAAVRYAGYRSEDEEDLEDDEELEDDDVVEYEETDIEPQFAAQRIGVDRVGAAPAIPTSVTSSAPVTVLDEEHHESIPEYSAPTKESGVKVGANGYAVEKKAAAAADDAKDTAH